MSITKPEPYPCDKRESCARPCPRALNGLGYEVLTLKPEGYRNLSGIVFPNFCRANIHGHLHSKIMGDDRYVNVSAEQINLTPVLLDKVLAKLPEIQHDAK